MQVDIRQEDDGFSVFINGNRAVDRESYQVASNVQYHLLYPDDYDGSECAQMAEILRESFNTGGTCDACGRTAHDGARGQHAVPGVQADRERGPTPLAHDVSPQFSPIQLQQESIMPKDWERIREWKQEFERQPHIWWTEAKFVDSEGIKCEPTGNFYESKEAAMVEVEWKKRRGERIFVRHSPIHSMSLSSDRWRD